MLLMITPGQKIWLGQARIALGDLGNVSKFRKHVFIPHFLPVRGKEGGKLVEVHVKKKIKPNSALHFEKYPILLETLRLSIFCTTFVKCLEIYSETLQQFLWTSAKQGSQVLQGMWK